MFRRQFVIYILMILLVISVSYPSNLNLKIFLKKGCKIPETVYFISFLRLFFIVTSCINLTNNGEFNHNQTINKK